MNPLISETTKGVVTKSGEMTEAKASYWAKGGCRRCHGRGVQHFSHPNGSEATVACSCSMNRMEKAGQDGYSGD